MIFIKNSTSSARPCFYLESIIKDFFNKVFFIFDPTNVENHHSRLKTATLRFIKN